MENLIFGAVRFVAAAKKNISHFPQSISTEKAQKYPFF